MTCDTLSPVRRCCPLSRARCVWSPAVQRVEIIQSCQLHHELVYRNSYSVVPFICSSFRILIVNPQGQFIIIRASWTANRCHVQVNPCRANVTRAKARTPRTSSFSLHRDRANVTDAQRADATISQPILINPRTLYISLRTLSVRIHGCS